MKISIASLAIIFWMYFSSGTALLAQDIAAVDMTGKVLVHKTGEPSSSAKNLLRGPVRSDQVLVLKDGARVLLLMNPYGQTCELTKPGAYEVAKLTFSPRQEVSLFSKFGDFFMSFFSEVPRTDDKKLHDNVIVAASRGNSAKPVPLCPLEGWLSVDDHVIDFKWLQDVDTSSCILRVYDHATRKVVYSRSVKGNSWVMNAADKVFVRGKKYYWDVQGGLLDEKSDVRVFTISDKGNLSALIDSMQARVVSEKIPAGSMSHAMLVTALLFEADHPNYSWQYGRRMKKDFPRDLFLHEKLDDACNREMIRRALEVE